MEIIQYAQNSVNKNIENTILALNGIKCNLHEFLNIFDKVWNELLLK